MLGPWAWRPAVLRCSAWVCTRPGVRLACRPGPAAGAEASLLHFGTDVFLFMAVGSGHAAESYSGPTTCPSGKIALRPAHCHPGEAAWWARRPICALPLCPARCLCKESPFSFLVMWPASEEPFQISLVCRGARLKFSGCSRRGGNGGGVGRGPRIRLFFSLVAFCRKSRMLK